MYTLTLADGTKLENLTLSGNNFISDEKIDESVFEDNLSTLTISDGETETVMHNVELVQQVTYPWDSRWYLVFRELSPEELYRTELNSKIEYLAMMSNIDLEV